MRLVGLLLFHTIRVVLLLLCLCAYIFHFHYGYDFCCCIKAKCFMQVICQFCFGISRNVSFSLKTKEVHFPETVC